MWQLLCGLLFSIGFILAEEPTSKVQNTTNEERNINKRYILTIPQYSSVPYVNNQIIPKQQLIFDNNDSLLNYINILRSEQTPYGITPNYYILQNNLVPQYPTQNVVPQILKNAPQQILLQRLIQQQQLIPQQQVLPQQIVQGTGPQIQVAPQQIFQQVVPQRIVQVIQPQQVVPQQVIPQKIVPQSIATQRVPFPQVPQRILPQKIVQQNIVPQQIASQRIVPQQVFPQKLLPQLIPPQINQNIIPNFQQQGIAPQIQSNILPLLVQQIVPYPYYNGVPAPFQYPFYQPEPPGPRVAVNKEPYPYEVPPGRTRLPIPTGHQIPIYVKSSQPVYPNEGFQNVVYPSGTTPHQQGTPNPRPVYINPYLQPNSVAAQHVVRIGYGHPHFHQQGAVQNVHPNNAYSQQNTDYPNPNVHASSNTQPVERIGCGPSHFTQQRIVQNVQPQIAYNQQYINPNVDTSGNAQQVVRIGYGHTPHFNQEVIGDTTDNGPQQIKLDIPFASAAPNGYGNGYQYGNNDRSTRTVDISKNNEEFKQKAEKTER